MKVCDRAVGKVGIKIDTKKGFGMIEGVESHGFRITHPFPLGQYNYSVAQIPETSTDVKTCPTSLLSALAKCTRIAPTHCPALTAIRITPGGEFGATDGKRMLLEQTTARFPWTENIMVRATNLYRVRLWEFRDRDSFDLSVRDGWVCFDFGDCRFFTKPDADHFPNLYRILPDKEKIRTRLTLAPEDVSFLKREMFSKKSEATLSLLCDYDHTVSIHDPTADKAVRLVRSRYEGDAMILRTKPRFLLEAFSLKCLDFQFGDSYPTGLATGTTYCWMPDEMSHLPLESERPGLSTTFVLSDQPSTTKKQ